MSCVWLGVVCRGVAGVYYWAFTPPELTDVPISETVCDMGGLGPIVVGGWGNGVIGLWLTIGITGLVVIVWGEGAHRDVT